MQSMAVFLGQQLAWLRKGPCAIAGASDVGACARGAMWIVSRLGETLHGAGRCVLGSAQVFLGQTRDRNSCYVVAER